MFDAQIKIISLFMKKSKKPTKIENCPLEKISEWFGHKTGEPTGCDYLVQTDI